LKIDYSQLQAYCDCPRKYYYKYVKCLKKIQYDESIIDADFGSCIHNALHKYYLTGNMLEAMEGFKKEFNGLESEKVKTPKNGLELLKMYEEYWKQPTGDLSDSMFETLELEKVSEFEIAPNLTYIVKIDRIAKHKTAGIFVIDHKTTKGMPYNYFWKFDPNLQVDGYCYYATQTYGQCSGFIPNVMDMGYRERKYLSNPPGFHCKFVREIVNRNKEQLEDFKEQVEWWAWRLQTSLDNNIFPRNKGRCNDFRGCTYKDLCKCLDDEQVLETMYEVVNTRKYLEEEEVK